MICPLFVKCFCYVLDGLSLLFLLSFLSFAFLRKRKIRAERFRPEILCSWACLSVLSVCALFSGGECPPMVSSCAGFTVSPLVLANLLPGRAIFLVPSVVMTLFVILAGVLTAGSGGMESLSWVFLVLMMTQAFSALHSEMKRDARSKPLPKLLLLKLYNDLLFTMTLFNVAVLMVALSAFSALSGGLISVIVPPLCLLAHILVFIVRTSEILSDDKPLQNDDVTQRSNGLGSLCIEPSGETDGNTYLDIYVRLVEYFEDEKPYLNPNMSIMDVARSMFSNKAYISKAVNLCTGRNFCQFVNYYRIKYSVETFIADPSLKLNKLARLSGFNSVPSFNLAFRLYMNETPREWCRRYVQEHDLTFDEK